MTEAYKKKTLFLISGGVEALPIIETARSMGLRTVVSDGNREAPGFALADEAVLASTYDADLTARLAIESSKGCKIDGVIAAAADVPVTVSAVAAALGIFGPSKESAFLASEKFAMKEKFKEHGVPVPWYALVGTYSDLTKYLLDSKEYVIKPVDSRGARGVIRLTPGTDIEWAFNDALSHSPSGRVMVEEWIEGAQISTESIVTEQGLVTPGLSDRNYSYLDRFAPFVIEDGGDLPAALSAKEKREIDAVLKKAAQAFGVSRATLKGDIILTDTGPVVIEVALRLSGGYFATHTIPLSSGVNIVEAAIRIALGEEFDLQEYSPTRSTSVCQRFLFPKPGKVKRVEVDKSVLADPSCEMLKLYLKVGDVVEEVKNHPCRSGMVITTGVDRDAAQKSAFNILSKINIDIDNLRMEV